MTMEWTLMVVVVIGLASLFAAYKIGGSTKEGRIDTLARALDSEVERAESLTKALAAMENSRNQQAWARKEQVVMTTKATDERDELIRVLDECTKHAGREVERPGDGGPPEWLDNALAIVAKFGHYVPDIVGVADVIKELGKAQSEMSDMVKIEGDSSTDEKLHTDFLMENNPKGRVRRGPVDKIQRPVIMVEGVGKSRPGPDGLKIIKDVTVTKVTLGDVDNIQS